MPIVNILVTREGTLPHEERTIREQKAAVSAALSLSSDGTPSTRPRCTEPRTSRATFVESLSGSAASEPTSANRPLGRKPSFGLGSLTPKSQAGLDHSSQGRDALRLTDMLGDI